MFLDADKSPMVAIGGYLVMFKKKARASKSKRPIHIRVVEDDREVADLVRRALESYKPVNFAVEFVATSRQLRDQLGRSAFRDESTGVHGGPFFLELLNCEGVRAHRFGRDLSCLALSLDGFHPRAGAKADVAADAVLREVAGLIQETVRTGDLVARYREDEFCVLLIETSLEEAASIAERIRFQIASHAVSIDGESLSVTASVGVSCLGKARGESPEAVLHRALGALETATGTGNHVCVKPAEARPTADEADSQQVDLGQQEDRSAADGRPGDPSAVVRESF